MKELLIIFVILLVLLMLISTFGGSIRQKESFVQVSSRVIQEEAPPVFRMPNIPQPDLTPLPSNPPFDIPGQIPKFDLKPPTDMPPKIDLKNNIEPFQQYTSLYGAPV